MSMAAASIVQHCKTLRLSSMGTQFVSLAEEASRQNHSHLHYLQALLQAEVEDRERRSIELRLKDAHLPRIKTLEEFDFAQSPHIPASHIRVLSEGGYLERAEPVLLVGEPGTGKTHLATGLAIAALPPAEARSFHHSSRTGQPARRSPARTESHSHAEKVGQCRTDCHRRTGICPARRGCRRTALPVNR
jgi:DNA replication protein DnaC